MHAANHPYTQHLTEDVWHADPRRLVASRPVGWLHASPDCTHFSQAKGGQPRARATRSLSWVVCKWAGQAGPRILSLENVKQLLGWGPLVAKRDAATGRVVTLDVITDAEGRKAHRVAARGERVPLERQFLVPDKRRAGQTWRRFVAHLQSLGYAVEWRRIRASDHGAGTSRERLFVIARRDGAPIRWPEPTHGPGCAHPFVTAADCIDWSTPCPSIFSRKKPLADATLSRIARGLKRYVIDASEPYIVGVPTRPETDNAGDLHQRAAAREARGTGRDAREAVGARSQWGAISLQSPTGIPGGCRQPRDDSATLHLRPPEHADGRIHASGQRGRRTARVAPLVTEHANSSNNRSWCATEPLRTQCAGVKGGHFALVTAFLEQANGSGPNGHPARARGATEPVSAITGTGSQQRLVTAHMATLRRNATGAAATDPLGTVCAQAEHHAVVELQLSPEAEAGALRVAAFLMRYHSTGGQWADLRAPLTAVTTKDRLALVTVTIRGAPYVIVDIGLRMLRPRELYTAQGFPTDYVIERTADGRVLAGYEQVRMVGNSVSPPPLRAIAAANLDPVALELRTAA